MPELMMPSMGFRSIRLRPILQEVLNISIHKMSLKNVLVKLPPHILWCSEVIHPLLWNEWPQSLLWRHNGHEGVSNHQHHHCLLNRLFRRRSKKTSKLRITALCAGNSQGTGEFPAKWPVTRKMSPFDDVIMLCIDMEWVATVTADFIWKVCAFVFPQSFDLQCKEELFIFEANETPLTCCPDKESVYLNQMFIVCEICKFRGRVKTITYASDQWWYILYNILADKMFYEKTSYRRLL